MSFAVIAINCQYDYLPGGPLDTDGSVRVIQNITAHAQQADMVICTRDWHPENHFSFDEEPIYNDGSWPPHCIQRTKGARIFPALRKQADYVISLGMNRNPPDDYSAFTGKTLRPVEYLYDILTDHPVDAIVIGGFLFESVVARTAFDAHAMSARWNVIVPLDCVGTLEDTTESNEYTIAKQLNASGIETPETWNASILA